MVNTARLPLVVDTLENFISAVEIGLTLEGLEVL
jgi:hypothetical protein